MRTIFTCALRGMGWPLSLRAVQVMPPTYTAPVGTALSMLSVTRAVWPSTRSALVKVVPDMMIYNAFVVSGTIVHL